ncbi:MAG: hypothetical protein R3F49_14195 [Planctomycetota bacterium]
MILATVGWGLLWTSLLAHKLGWWHPSALALQWVASVPAALGALYALATVRARRTWVLVAAVALFANISLLLVPVLFTEELRWLLGPHGTP